MNKGSSDTIWNILNNKATRAKEKVTSISQLLLDNKLTIQQLIDTASRANDKYTATIIESLEYATKSTN